jgi:hypothetical protein
VSIKTYEAEWAFQNREAVHARRWITGRQAKALIRRHVPDAEVRLVRARSAGQPSGFARRWFVGSGHIELRPALIQGSDGSEKQGFCAVVAMHEAAHLVAPRGAHHGPEFRRTLVDILHAEWGGVAAGWLLREYEKRGARVAQRKAT